MRNKNESLELTVKLDENQLMSLVSFLERTRLEGAEVPVFIEIMRAIHSAPEKREILKKSALPKTEKKERFEPRLEAQDV